MIKNTILLIILFLTFSSTVLAKEMFFQVQSIDTMKYSRDLAREKMDDQTFDQEIDRQVSEIAQTGATHVAIGTPYDEEFVPYLKRWISSIRNHSMNVWFRGNFSGWEEWFDYPKIDRNTHLTKTKEFILNHPDLFADGDIFSSCPECENGGPGDPRKNGDVTGFRNFLIEEYKVSQNAFAAIGKKVSSNYFSMNGDVARLIMDKETTSKLDGIVTVDHYVSTPEKLVNDIKDFAEKSGGKVVLGEFGVPIPDIHGNLTDKEQAKWINKAMGELIKMPEVVGVNYWTNKASSTELWNDDNTARSAVTTISIYFNPINISGLVKDASGNNLSEVTVKTRERTVVFQDGEYSLPVLKNESILFSKHGYISESINIGPTPASTIQRDIILAKSYPTFIDSLFAKIIIFTKTLLNIK